LTFSQVKAEGINKNQPTLELETFDTGVKFFTSPLVGPKLIGQLKVVEEWLHIIKL
jgi:hypothetical protein